MMIAQPISRKYYIALSLFSAIVLIGVYSFFSIAQHAYNPSDTLIPNGGQFIHGINKVFGKDIFGDRWIVKDLLASGERLVVGLCTGIVLSIVVGVFTGCFEFLAALINPPLIFVSKIPATAMLALYFVAFGTGEVLYTALIGFGIFPGLSLAIYGAVKKDVNADMIQKTYTLGASHMEAIVEAVFMQIFPRILQNIQLSIGPAMVFLIAAEWLLADAGIGYRLRMQSRLLNMNIVFLYLSILGMSGFIIDYSLVRIRRFLCPWFGE